MPHGNVAATRSLELRRYALPVFLQISIFSLCARLLAAMSTVTEGGGTEQAGKKTDEIITRVGRIDHSWPVIRATCLEIGVIPITGNAGDPPNGEYECG